ncbi:DNA-formamidopyrimidine glycosylase family protein [Candidatus Poriferisodalis sp.]|uniref:DNA-formamidopyrimidine glycosylase family protein n=1 Tax=Candidatus Poriferisodalis sp. TaxID=3101277 RepID=UPI003B02604C
MPEIPEIRAHAERLETLAAGEVLKRVEPLSFTAFKTASPQPSDAVGWPLCSVGQRAKFLLLRFARPTQDPAGGGAGRRGSIGADGGDGGGNHADGGDHADGDNRGDGLTFVVHLMQGGRLRVLEAGAKRPRRPRDGLVRFEFDSGLGLMLTEPGTQKRAGVWVLDGDVADAEPITGLGPEATELDADGMAELMSMHSGRLHNFLRDQRVISGLGRRLANEICHRAKLSPFASVGRLDADAVGRVVAAIEAVVDESLAFERGRPEMSRAAERPSAVHGRTGEPCVACDEVVRAVDYRDYSVNYCASCQTGGRVLADNTTSKFLR